MQPSVSENRIAQSKAMIGWNCLKAICACVFSRSKNLHEGEKIESKGLTLGPQKLVNQSGLTPLIRFLAISLGIFFSLPAFSYAASLFPGPQFSVGSYPQSVTTADFNGDGNADMAVANQVSSNVSVLLGDGLGGFAPAVNFAAGGSPISVTTADFNGDGKADLVVADSWPNALAVLLGDGLGGFGPAVFFPTGGYSPSSVMSADFNGDGKADIAVVNTGGISNVGVLLGDGLGGFAPAVNFAAGITPYSVTTADFNGDGKADLAVANQSSNNVSVLLGDGLGGFAPAVNFAAGTAPYSVTTADFNGDGKADMAVANNGSQNFSVLLGDGLGGFGPAVNFQAGVDLVSVTSADFNGDGNADVAVVNSRSNNVSVFLGDGLGGLGVVNLAAGTTPSSVTTADFNGDGKTDMAVANYGSNNVSVLLGVGLGGFAPAVNFAAGTWPSSVTTADFNGDGKPDMAVANSGSNLVSVLLGDGLGGFAPAVNFAAGFSAYSVTTADFNGDGKADMAVTDGSGGNTVSVLLGDGLGGFAPAVNFVTGNGPYSVISADFNGDGKPDMAVANYYLSNVSVLLGDGLGGFAPAVNFAVGSYPTSVTSADFNGDGKPDIAVANGGSSNVSVLLGDGLGGFAPAVNFAVGYGADSVTTADFNGDGKPDIAVANGGPSNVSVLLGDGLGGFASAINFAVGYGANSVTTADFNGDGNADMVVANQSSNNVSVLLNLSPPSISSIITNFTVIDNPTTSALDFTVNLSAPLPAGYTLAVNFDDQQGGWLFNTPGWSVPLTKGLNGTTYTLSRVMNKPGLRSYRIGIFDPNGQLVGQYTPSKTCLTATCLATIERNNVVGDPAARGSHAFKNVDVVSGNYHFVSTDMSVSGKGVSFSLTRAYNSLGMRSTLPKPLTFQDPAIFHPWTFAHEMQVRFMDDTPSTGLAAPTNRQAVVGPMEDGSLLYYFKDMDQKWYTLTPGNFKALIQNANGTFTLYSKGDRIYQFADPNGVGKGRLNKMENRLHKGLTYHYGANNVLTSVTDANNRSYAFTYATGALGHKILLRVSDFSGRSVIYTYDTKEMITQVKNVRGGFERYTYSGGAGINNHLITIKDPRNTATPQMSLTYDAGGRVLTLVDGTNQTTSFVYGLDNTVGEITGIKQPVVDALNHNLVYVLDAKRTKVIQRIDAKSYQQGVALTVAANDIKTTQAYKAATSRTTLADKALVATTTDPNNNSTNITYDASIGRANPATIVDAKNRTVAAAYVAVALQPNLTPVTSVTQPGVATPTKYQRFTTTGKAQDTIDARSFKTTRAFDADDQMLTSTNPRLNATHYTYDAFGNVLSITDAKGSITTRTYDTLGRLSTELSPLGLTTTYTYDANGNTLTRRETAAGINYLTSYLYDANNNLTQTTDPKNHVTKYTYDNMDRKTQESYTVGGIPHVRSFTYNALGKLATVTDERGFASQTHYTSRNQVAYKVDPFLKHTITYTYDKNGNVATATDAVGRKVTTTYDVLNRKTQVVDSKGNTQKWIYNTAGQIATYTDARLKVTSYLYDAVGNVTQVTDAKGGITTSTYDGNGNVITVTDPSNHTTTYAYDALDRRISTTLHDGRKWTYTYDANGNMLTETTPTGEKTVKTYDPLNRIASLKEYATNGITITRSISYAYDANGNVTRETSGANTIAYTYDEINRITGITDQYGKTVSYGYDKAGNRTALTYPGNKTVTYVYDKAGRLNSLKDWLNKTTTYTRNFAGQVTQVANGNGTSASYIYDTAGRLTNLTNKAKNGTVISSQAMVLDGAGNITQSTMNLPLLPTLPPSTGTMAYDTTNRLTAAGGNSYTSDLAGRTITETKGATQTTYHFDIKDHITSITQGATTLSSYGYDLKNNRISQIQNGVETRYVIDQLASLPNVLAETNNLGVISNYYIYGEGLVSQITAAGVSHYYHYGPTGNTLALTNSAGSVSDTFAYAPYGFTTSTGATHNPFRFVGKHGVMDDGNGLHYMRARYYKEDIKRFVSLDALHGDIMTPQKLNRYAYALGNPVMGIDPSGKAVADPKEVGVNLFTTAIESYMENARDVFVSLRVDGGSIKYSLFRYTKSTQEYAKGSFQVLTSGVFATLNTFEGCSSDIRSVKCATSIEKTMASTLTSATAGAVCSLAGPYGALVCSTAASMATNYMLDEAYKDAYELGKSTHQIVQFTENLASTTATDSYNLGAAIHRSGVVENTSRKIENKVNDIKKTIRGWGSSMYSLFH